jgi:hypothetical protein
MRSDRLPLAGLGGERRQRRVGPGSGASEIVRRVGLAGQPPAASACADTAAAAMRRPPTRPTSLPQLPSPGCAPSALVAFARRARLACSSYNRHQVGHQCHGFGNARWSGEVRSGGGTVGSGGVTFAGAGRPGSRRVARVAATSDLGTQSDHPARARLVAARRLRRSLGAARHRRWRRRHARQPPVRSGVEPATGASATTCNLIHRSATLRRCAAERLIGLDNGRRCASPQEPERPQFDGERSGGRLPCGSDTTATRVRR